MGGTCSEQQRIFSSRHEYGSGEWACRGLSGWDADAVKAMDHIGDANKMVPDKSLSPLSRIADSFGVTGTWDQIADAVIARSTPAAPVVDVATLRALSDRWANDRSYTGSPVDDIRALIEQPTMSTPASSADSAVLTNPYTGQPRDYRDVESDPAGTLIVEPGKPLEAASTPAASGIDIEQFRDKAGAIVDSMDSLNHSSDCRCYQYGHPEDSCNCGLTGTRQEAKDLLALIDASPKGDDTRRLDQLEDKYIEVADEFGVARQLYFGTFAGTLRDAIDADMKPTSHGAGVSE